MPYIKKNRRFKLNEIVKYIGENARILEDNIDVAVITTARKMMEKANIQVNGDLNYLFFALAKRYIKPSYNNYKKYLSKLRCDLDYSVRYSGNLEAILFDFSVFSSKVTVDDIEAELDCCKREIYRKLVGPYEDKAEKRNGSVE